MDVGDLGRSARVCRTWKVLIQANILWSKVMISTFTHMPAIPSATLVLNPLSFPPSPLAA